MNNNFKLADFVENDAIVNQISKFENELKNNTGKDIVLIAYTNEE